MLQSTAKYLILQKFLPTKTALKIKILSCVISLFLMEYTAFLYVLHYLISIILFDINVFDALGYVIFCR